MKIDIKIENNRKFAEIAFLVDRDDFLEDIEEVRHRINLSKPPYVFPEYPYKEANRIVGFYKNQQISINGARELLEEFCSEQGLLNLYALDKALGTATIFSESLSRKYNKSRLYIPVILASILIAEIHEEDFLSTQMFEINRKVLKEELYRLEKDEKIITISVSRESTPEEVKRVFNFIQRYYFKTKPSDGSDGLKNIYTEVPETKVPDEAANVKRDRDWYWLKREGWSYQEIKRHYKENDKCTISLRGVELAIKRYSGKLK